MKNLLKISRKITTKFCWQEMSSFGSETTTSYEAGKEKEVVITPDLNDLKHDVSTTPESKEYQHQKPIDAALKKIKNGEQISNGFESIPASAFLSRNAAELQTLFIVNGVVDFRGNIAVKRELGLVDLFTKVSTKQQFVVLNGVNYGYGARRSDGKIGYGNPNYKAILGGETIEYFVAETSSQSFVEKTEDLKNNDKSTQYLDPPAYHNFAGLSADYLDDMNNLTADEEQAEKKDFLAITKNKEISKNRSYVELKEIIEQGEGLEILKKIIAQGEGNYESHNNGTAGVPGSIPGGKKLSNLTLREIMMYQQPPNRKLFAVGKYQFIPATLAEAVNYTGIDIDTKFSPQTQEALFTYLISAQKRPLLNAYLTGKVTGSYYLTKAHKELSLEFASIAGPDGKGSYDGIAGNMASNNTSRISSILKEINNNNIA